MKKIVIDDAVPYAKEIFSHLGHVSCLPGKEISHHDVIDADALIVRSRTQINAGLLENTRVKFVGSTVVGLDHVDQDFLSKNQIYFYSAQGCNANSVAEFVFTQMVTQAEKFGFDLSEKSLAIIGVGNVGKRLQSKAEALGMQLFLNDPPRQEQEPENKAFCDLETALKADIISFHTPLTSKGKHPTHHLLSAQRLKKLSKNQILINAARGGIIDEQAWVETETRANLIDCWENEPNINPALYEKANMATPHIAGHSLDAKINGSEMVYKQLCLFWQQSIQKRWQDALPPKPNSIRVNEEILNHGLQTALLHVLTSTHDPLKDDLAIRNQDFMSVVKQYEHYRRHYPIHREWQHHTVLETKNTKLNALLASLGFQVQ